MELLLEILAHFGTSLGDANYSKIADLNGDGHVSVHDLFMFLAQYTGG